MRVRRSDFSTEAYFFDSPIEVALFFWVGPLAGAFAALAGFGAAAAIRKGSAAGELLHQGAARSLIAVLLWPAHGLLLWLLVGSTTPFLWYALVVTTITLLVVLSKTPFIRMRSGMPLSDIVARTLCDRVLWWGILLTVIWGFALSKYWTNTPTLVQLVSWAALAIVSILARAWDNQRARVTQLQLSVDAIAAMVSIRDPLPQLTELLESLHVPSYRETIWVLMHDDRKGWVEIATHGAERKDHRALAVRAHALAHLPEAPDREFRTSMESDTIHAFVITSAKTGVPEGALVMLSEAPPSPLHVRDVAASLDEIAPLLSLLRSIAVTESAVETDSLTAIKNRAGILRDLNTMLTGSRVGCVLMLDVDRFKRINDTFGHAAGDACLQGIAGAIAQCLRSNDSVGRLGGDEFLVVAPSIANRAAAADLADRLRRAASTVRIEGGEVTEVTVSIGAALLQRGDAAADVLARADGALYDAKRRGRNRSALR